jgi:hypothetical protein
VVLVHAVASVVVHCTHAFVPVTSQTLALGSVQSISPVHVFGPDASCVSRQSSFVLPGQKFAFLQAPSKHVVIKISNVM